MQTIFATMLRSLRRFYINKNSNHDFAHVGHFQCDIDNANRGIRDVPQHALQMITKLFENHCPASIAELFLETSGGGKLLQKSAFKLREIVLITKTQVEFC